LRSTAELFEVLEQRPEFLFIPLVLLVFGPGLLSSGPASLSVFLQYLLNPNPDPGYAPIHVVTFSAAWGSLLLGIYKLRERLGLLRSILVSASVPFGATGLFEIVYLSLGRLSQPWAFSQPDWVGLLIWSSPVIATLPFWRRRMKFPLAMLITTGAGFLIWFIVGYPQVTWGNFFQLPVAYLLNSTLKLLCFMVFLIPLLSYSKEQLFSFQRVSEK
jgi:hypothetical protein